MPSILSVFLAEFGHFLLLLHILLHFAHHLLINFTSERFFTLSHFGLQLPSHHYWGVKQRSQLKEGELIHWLHSNCSSSAGGWLGGGCSPDINHGMVHCPALPPDIRRSSWFLQDLQRGKERRGEGWIKIIWDLRQICTIYNPSVCSFNHFLVLLPSFSK